MAYKLSEPGWFATVNGIKVVRHPLPLDFMQHAGDFIAHHGIELHRQQGDGTDITGTQIDRGYPIAAFNIGNDGTICQYCHVFDFAPWHGDSVSEYAFGIEHAGFTGKPFTAAQLRSSHALSAALIEITEDRFGEIIPAIWVPSVTVSNYRTVKGFWNHKGVQDGPLNENGHHNLLEGESTAAYCKAVKALLPGAKKAPPFPKTLLLKEGVTDVHVIQWKRRMAAKHLFVLHNENDGPHYGNVIERATRAFQTQRKIAVDGIVGPETWAEGWAA